MKRGLGLLGLGAGLMYLWDPERGVRRRAGLRDKAVHALHMTGDALETSWHDLRNRARGLAAQARAALRREAVADAVIAERVRAKIGRVVSHPRSIGVSARGREVILNGPILAKEVEGLLAAVSRVRGVRRVKNHLEVHERQEEVPGLQGVLVRPGERIEFLQENWSPAARVLAGGTGGALALYGLRSGGVFGATLGALGLGLLARGATNMRMKRLVGVGAGRRAVELYKTITIDAPVDRVFTLWSRYANFPTFMSHVREVRDIGDWRSHWVVEGPGGVDIEWDAVLTSMIPNKELGWRTEPGAAVQHAGLVRFDRNPDGTTRMHLRLAYNPPGGAVGHALADMLGADPKARLDGDLARMKTFLEAGKLPHDAARPVSGATPMAP